jgi:hypothetical protein
VNVPEDPDEAWNAFETYYPGDDVVDMTGVSVFGAQLPGDEYNPDFVGLMDGAYWRLVDMAPDKPVFVFELAAAMGSAVGDEPAIWADYALAGLLSGRWPSVHGFAWWNDSWANDDDPEHDTEMRVEIVPGLGATFETHLTGASDLGDGAPIAW